MTAAARLTAVFAKAPVAGQVKTRLCPPLAPEQAAELAEALLADALARLCADARWRTRLVFAPEGAEAWLRARFGRELARGLEFEAQRGAGLGERLERFFARAFDASLASLAPLAPLASAAKCATVCALGADAPLLENELVERAHAELESGAELVLGPDAGGGYYLIGLRAPCASLFREVAMSSAGMAEATLALARARGLRTQLLPLRRDLDTPADLAQFELDLAAAPAQRRARADWPRASAAWIARWSGARAELKRAPRRA